MTSQDVSRGARAIDEALRQIYGDVPPVHRATPGPQALPGLDPLEAVVVYEQQEPVPHWHYVSYGLTELHGKESEDPERSGFGFELSFRLARYGEGAPPTWPVDLVQGLARYVFQSGNVFAPGHHVDLHAPLGPDATDLSCLLFARDPELGERDGPNGRFGFVQLVGATGDEHEAAQAWNVEALLDVLAERSALLVTDRRRASVLADPSVRARVEAGTARDGSSSSQVFTTELAWRGTEVSVGAAVVPQIVRALRGRILHGRPFLVVGPTAAVGFEPADAAQVDADDPELLRVGCTAALAEEMLAALAPHPGSYTFRALPELVVRVTGDSGATG